MKKILTPSFLTVTALIAFAAVGRIFTPLPNFTPIAAIALFGGAYFSNKSIAFLIPLATLAVTNLFLPTFDWITTTAVYIGFILTGILGIGLGRKISVVRTAGAALLSSILFFVITNLATWISGFCGYPMTFGGLMLCYEMALPFFRNELLGTLIYSGILFGVFEFAKHRIPALAR